MGKLADFTRNFHSLWALKRAICPLHKLFVGVRGPLIASGFAGHDLRPSLFWHRRCVWLGYAT